MRLLPSPNPDAAGHPVALRGPTVTSSSASLIKGAHAVENPFSPLHFHPPPKLLAVTACRQLAGKTLIPCAPRVTTSSWPLCARFCNSSSIPLTPTLDHAAANHRSSVSSLSRTSHHQQVIAYCPRAKPRRPSSPWSQVSLSAAVICHRPDCLTGERCLPSQHFSSPM
jgi:hypothetical protein